MKSPAKNVALRAAIAALALLAITPASRAADGVWDAPNAVSSSWNDAGNWLGGVIPGGIGSAITIQNNGGALSLDAPFTIGKFFLDVSASWWELHPGVNGGALTFDNGAEMPELWLTPTANNYRLWLRAPVHGTNGLLIARNGGGVFCQFFTSSFTTGIESRNTLSGECVLSNGVVCILGDNNALGSAKVTVHNGTQLRVNNGLVFTNDITLAGGALLYSDSYYGAGGFVTFNGTVTSLGSDSIYAGAEGAPPIVFNGPIIGTHPNGTLTFRANATGLSITLNAPVTLNGESLGNGNAVFIHTGAKLVVNNRFTWQGGRVNIKGGSIVFGTDNAFDTENYIRFDTGNETFDHLFDLNGFNQRIGGFVDGATANDRHSRVTSAKPATLTLDIPENTTRNMNQRSYIDGALTVVKTGAGTQQFTCTFADNLIDKWIVEDGSLILNSGLFSANALINGGTLGAGTGNPTMLFRFDGDAHDAMILESGALDTSRMSIRFEGAPDNYGEYVILDASAPNTTFTAAAESPDSPFVFIDELPENCRLKTSADKRKVWLVLPHPGTMLLIK